MSEDVEYPSAEYYPAVAGKIRVVIPHNGDATFKIEIPLEPPQPPPIVQPMGRHEEIVQSQGEAWWDGNDAILFSGKTQSLQKNVIPRTLGV